MALLLDFVDLGAAARRVEQAVAADLATRTGPRGTREIGDALLARLTG